MFSFLAFVFGLVVGSFLNVVLTRLKAGEALTGRSRCPNCRKQLAWYHNIPVVSFLLLRGRCRYCQAPISWQYPLVEVASGLLWTLGYLWFGAELSFGVSFGSALPLLSFGVFSSFLLALFVFDLRWYILPDEVTLPGIVVVFVLGLLGGKDWQTLLLVGLVGAAWFWVQHAVSQGAWVGDGDIRLGALVALMVGSWAGLLLVFLLTYLSGALVGMGLMITRQKTWQSHLPLGTFLTAATVVVLLWGGSLWQWYSGFLW